MICKFHYYFYIIVYIIFNQMERAMYPTRNYFINNNGYSTNNNHQPQTGPPNANSTGFFPHPLPHQQNQNTQQHQQQPLSLSYIYPANSFQFRQQPPHVLNTQPPSAFPLPPLPPPPSFNQLPLQGFFAAPPFPTTNRQQPPQQLTSSNFAGRNVIFSSSTIQSSQNHLVNPPLAKVTVSSIQTSHHQQPILPDPPILPSTIPSPIETVPISDELHINASNLSEAISEDHNNPFGKRTVINEQALANLAKKNQQNDRTKEVIENPTQNVNGDDQQPNLAATTTESSPESVKIGDEQEEEDEEMENPEMPKNWRMMMLFNGRVRDSDLPPNCERPQNAEGIEFPYPDSLSKWKFVGLRQPPEDMDLDDEDSDEAGELSPMEGTSQQISGRRNKQSSRAKSLPPPPVPPPPPIVNQNERGYVLPNGRTWVRHPPQPPVEIAQQEKVKSPTTSSAIPPHPTHSPRNRIQKRFANNTLLIMKNGKRLQSGTKECYQFAETGTCQNGIFCTFEHNGSVEHTTKRVCNRLLRGLCPAETGDADNCPGGPHSLLLPHQMPICDFYQRLCCRKGKEKCPFLHVRHTPGTQPCAEFNRGNCQRGIMCDAPHRYYYDQIKQKSGEPKQPQIRSKTTTANQVQNRQNQQQNNNIRLHLNTENEATNSPNQEEQLKPPSPPLKWIDE